ncbi:VapE domain-containing protein [Lunatibacter salilacus]|uniref:VapE domain-containing protein n=1 Tax=Lunatibacter salilacus TaxID=2483804 RepID=UPI00131D4138|nr:VapE domain-containing protein [Lunatibacter salilacus]
MKKNIPLRELGQHANSSTIKMIRHLLTKYDFIYNTVLNEVFASEKEKEEFYQVNPHTLFIESREAGLRTSVAEINSFLCSDYIPKSNPFEMYFERYKDVWKEDVHGDYITRFSNYIKAEETERFSLQFKKWLVRCVACCLMEDYFNKQALIFVQDAQNSGKTTLTRFLIPLELSQYQAENISVDKDSLIALCQNFVIIQDELSTLSKTEINAQKTLMSKSFVKVRHPYDKKPRLEPRRASICGSTNRAEFLTDVTGSVRWLCFTVLSIDWDYKKDIDIDVVWSQAYHLFNSGFRYEMTAEEVAENERSNAQYSTVSLELELIQKYFQAGDKEDKFMTASEICEMLNAKLEGRLKVSREETGKALKKLGFIQHSKRGHLSSDFPVKGYYVKYHY